MDEVTVEAAVTAYVRRKTVGAADGRGGGTYASNAESILGRWQDWLQHDQNVTTLRQVDVETMRSYAITLDTLTERDEYTPSSARTYYAVVRAFLSWCVRGELIDSNPAAAEAAMDHLPSAESDSSNRRWTEDQRHGLETYTSERVLDTENESRRDRLGPLRDHALVSVIGHTNVRGGELFRVSTDDRRTGATWDDVDFYSGTIRVLGTSQRLEEVPLPAAARTPLRRYWVVLDPPTNEWPVFPTRHAPSIASQVRSVFTDRGYDQETIDELFDERTAIDLAREYAIPPPAITTEGARAILKRLCRNASVDVDGDYLTPRGARPPERDRPARREASSESVLRAPSVERSPAVVEDVLSMHSIGDRGEYGE